MSLKRKVNIILGSALLAAFVFMASMLSLFRANQRASEKENTAVQIMTDVFGRRLVGEEYIRGQTDRAKSQWLEIEGSIEQFIAFHEGQFETPEERGLIRRIQSSIAETRAVFENLIALYEGGFASADPQIFTEKSSRLGSQLSVKAQETIQLASRLKEINAASERQAFHQIFILFSAAGGFLLLLLCVSFWQIWVVTNTLEKKRSENAAILSGIGDGVFVIDMSRNIVLFNKASTQISGFTEGEAIGKSYPDILKFIDEKTGQPNLTFVETALGGAKTFMPHNTGLISRSGKIIPVADSAAPVFDAAGAIVGAVVVFRDITKEREIQRAKEEFISLASHQLYTPIVILSGYLDILTADLSGKVAAAHEPAFGAMQRAVLSLKELVGAMLNVSRVESGTIAITPEPLDIVRVVDDVLGEFASECKEKELQLVKKYEEGLPIVAADPKLMTAIARNLISNAVKYTPAKGVITVELAKTESEFIVSVSDTGLGIPKAQQEKMFEKFYRAENVRKNGIEGTGLGLYLVKSILDHAGGSIWFESEAGAGAQFHVSIPLSGMQKKEGMKGLT